MSEPNEPRAEPRGRSAVNAGRSPAAIVLVGLLGLAGMIYLLWPKPPARESLEASDAGSSWTILADKAVLGGPTMGTAFHVAIAGESFDREALARLQAEIDAELIAVNAQMSTYLPDSELSRFNAQTSTDPIAVSPELFAVVREAKRVSAASGGAFDVTVGPLVDAWGFGPDAPLQRTELDDGQITALREVVGDEKLELDEAKQTLRKRVGGLRVDLSAIAKGHGCDRVGAVIEAAGLHDYMVEIGGEVRARGHNGADQPWTVGIERPTADAAGSQVVQEVLRIADANVATSGDYRNYFEQDGVRYSHTIDPRTGRPITHALASVTVIHPDSTALADAWATALDVLGPDAGLATAEREGLAAYFLIRTDTGFTVARSSGFARMVAQ